LTPVISQRRVNLPLLWIAIVVAAVMLADQLSKAAVRGSIVPGETVAVLPGLQLVDATNHGVSFGLLTGDGLVVDILVGVALLALVVYFARNRAKALIWLPTGLVLGGAFSNQLDRIRDGSVTDFIKLPLGWPPFNLADSAITVGVVVLVLLVEGDRRQAGGKGSAQRPGTAQEGAPPDRLPNRSP
jgi:signal peptidase II